jgi:hypothetical protein
MVGMGAAAAGFFSSGRVLAGDSVTVAVLGLEANEGVPDSVAVGVTDALRQRMSMLSGYRLVQGRDLVEVKLVFSCPDEAPACMAQAAKSLGASRLIFGEVKSAGPDAYSITLKLFDAEKEVIESWTADQLGRAHSSGAALLAPVQKWIATLTGQSLPGTLHLQGGVVGALVTIDGVAAGVMGSGGLTITNVAAARHEITVNKPGYSPARKSVTLSSGETRDVAIELAAAAPAPGETPSAETPVAEPAATGPTEPTEAVKEEPTSTESDGSRVGFKVATWIALPLGLAGIGVGIYYSYLVYHANSMLDGDRRFPCTNSPTGWCDGSGTPKPPITDPGTIAWIQNTKSLGDKYQTYQWIWYGAGTALLATSAVFFYLGYLSHTSGVTADARGSSWQLAPVFLPNGAGALAFTTF